VVELHVRVPSEKTFFSPIVSIFTFFGFFASESFSSVRGVLSARSKNSLLFCCVTMVTPSATNAGRPPV
jgi:hypothetical protein